VKTPAINWTLRASIQRVLDSLPSILQIVVAATAAYSISHFLLGHKNPIFAVTVTIASLALLAMPEFAEYSKPQSAWWWASH
jgi:hypothetical protein